MSVRDRLAFDPTNISFAGMGLGQLAMIVFGVLVVSNEYSTGMIRTSLAAVPQRATLLFCKLLVATVLVFLVGLATSFATFFAGQALLGEHRAYLGDPGVLRAVFGGGLYMTLIALFSMGVATMLRSPMLSLGILMPFFFLISNILGNVSATRKVGRYLPDQAGRKVMEVVTPLDDERAVRPVGRDRHHGRVDGGRAGLRFRAVQEARRLTVPAGERRLRLPATAGAVSGSCAPFFRVTHPSPAF